MRYRLLTLLLVLGTLTAIAKDGNEKQAYVFGFATSFMDSVVYVTPIQTLSPVKWLPRTHLLDQRKVYSEQMRYYLNNQNLTDRTIVVFWDKKRKNVEKRWQKLKKRYTQKLHYEWKEIGAEAFQFKVPSAEE